MWEAPIARHAFERQFAREIGLRAFQPWLALSVGVRTQSDPASFEHNGGKITTVELPKGAGCQALRPVFYCTGGEVRALRVRNRRSTDRKPSPDAHIRYR